MYDVVVIGGGPAGLTAAVYSGRRSLKTLVLTRDIGGQISKSHNIENYPGVDQSTGAELAQKFLNQAKKFGAEVKFYEAKEIIKNDKFFTIKTNKEEYQSKSIILASGKKPRELEVPGEEKFKGAGVSYCATCDMPFFKEKTVAVIGGGNSALDAAILAGSVTKKVYLIYRGEQLRAEQVLIDNAKKNNKIEFILNDNIKEIKGDQKVESIDLESGKNLSVDGVFAEIGYVVDRSLFENIVKLNERGQVIIDHNQATSVPGIFAAGDLTTTEYKQVVIAAGEGAKAALSAFGYIQRLEGKGGAKIDWGKP